MPMPAPKSRWEQSVDRAMRSCVRVFGDGPESDGLITYTHTATAMSYPADGIFEATTEEVDLDTGAVVLSNKPQVSFALSALQALPVAGDTCVIRGATYRVVQPNFDGQGTVTLRLHKA
jgi:hypothetical protein